MSKNPLHLVDGQLAQKARLHLGLKVSDIAATSRMSEAQVYRMEEGGNYHRETTCRALAAVLNISLDDLIMRKKPECLSIKDDKTCDDSRLVIDGTGEVPQFVSDNALSGTPWACGDAPFTSEAVHSSECPICADFKILSHANQGLVRQLIDALVTPQKQLKKMRDSLDSLLEI